MDGPSTPTEGSSPNIRLPGRRFSNSPRHRPFSARSGSRTVQEAPPANYFRHPVVLRLELNRRLGDRLINKLKSAALSGPQTLFNRELGQPDSREALNNASTLLDLISDEDTNQEITAKLQRFLTGPDISSDKALELKRLINFISNISPDDELSPWGQEFLQTLTDEFDGRAVSIFLQTRFGQFVLEQLKNSMPIDVEDEKKLHLGLKLIQTRLESRPDSAPDASLVEYASLYLGDDVDLDKPEHTEPVIKLTLQNILASRIEAEENDFRLQENLENILDGIKETYPDEEQIEWLYYYLKVDPELRNFLDPELLLTPDPQKLGNYLLGDHEEVSQLKKLVRKNALENHKKEDAELIKALDGATSGNPASSPSPAKLYWMLETIEKNPEYKKLIDFSQLMSEDSGKLMHYLCSGRKEISQLRKHLAKRLQKCGKDIDELDTIITSISDTPESALDVKHLAEVSKAIGKAQSHCGADPQVQTLGLLRDHLDYQILEHTKEKFIQEMRQQLKYLEESGSSRVITITTGIGAAAAVAGVKGIAAGAKFTYEFKVVKGDDGRTREFHIGTPSISAKIGDGKVVSVTASGAYSGAKGRVFRSTEEFIRFHSNDFVPVLMSSMQKIPGNTKGSIDSRRAERLHSHITADRQLLSQRLAELGVIHPGDQVRVKQSKPVNYADFTQHSISGTLTVSALAGVLEGNIKLQNRCTNFRTRTNLRQMLQHNPDKAFPPHIEYLSFWAKADVADVAYYRHLQERLTSSPGDNPYLDTPQFAAKVIGQFKEEDCVVSKRQSGDECIQWLNMKARDLSSHIFGETSASSSPSQQKRARKKRLEIREQVKSSMMDQFMERDMYYFTVNAMEGHIGEKSPQKYFHQAKHSMQAPYKAHDRGEFIAAHTYTFHFLKKLYESTFLPGETPVSDDAIFFQVLQNYLEPSLDNPQLHLSNVKHVRKSLTASSVAKSTEKSVSGDLTLSVPVQIPGSHTPQASLSLKGDFSFIIIGQNVNPDNDGLYFNVGVTLNAGASPTLIVKALGTALEKLKGQRIEDTTIPEISLAELAPDLSGLSAQAGARLEFNFVKRRKDWCLQYTRLLGKESVGLALPAVGIPIGPLVETNIEAGASVDTTKNWYERPGNNTITYLQAKYNGWQAGNMIKMPSYHVDPSDEEYMDKMKQSNPFYSYCLTHRKAISEMLVNLADPEKRANAELIEMFSEIDTLASTGFREHFSEQLKQYARSPDPNSKNFKIMVQQFEQLLRVYHNRYLETARKRYRPNIKKGRVI
ncbi:hypothetical protein M3P05_05940 [Sansalvadorimonas sp. 2012CJ34-2]|uniref:Uncharacterized protein n=1 Tax=Parendozoicomonas callyspongiae TaxID=2942213 RepID=A0ABT0PDN4_9GAMM|nr:hypothetical protein [Sansalvadorimonas sp. 2012CJ34-2]MCL6269480.1 hypothetical protein [Sansalvadorimonas sp. 2012CJ34-2]